MNRMLPQWFQPSFLRGFYACPATIDSYVPSRLFSDLTIRLTLSFLIGLL